MKDWEENRVRILLVRNTKDKELVRKLSKDFVSDRKLYHKTVKYIMDGQSSHCNKIRYGILNLKNSSEKILGS